MRTARLRSLTRPFVSRRPTLIASVAVVVVGVVILHTNQSTNTPASTPQARIVVSVTDGDTVVLNGGEVVRLIGLDTPESTHPTQPVECFGPEASNWTATQLPPGTPVRVEPGAEPTDRYGRTLGYLWRTGDGFFVNSELLAAGMARRLRIEPNIAYDTDFDAATWAAQTSGAGVWGVCNS